MPQAYPVDPFLGRTLSSSGEPGGQTTQLAGDPRQAGEKERGPLPRALWRAK